MDKINILYCFDSKFWRLVAVSVESLLSNAKPTTQVTVYCMVAPGTKGRNKIKRIIKSHKTGGGLVWREIDPSENPLFNPKNPRWDEVAFYRCFAHRFFKDIDKILCLNTVTLIYHDLAELFNTDISDYAFGAVRDMAPINDTSNATGCYIKDFSANYLNNGPYYNSGVLLLNLKKMAEFDQAMLDSKVPLRYPAQDLLNATFVGKIKSLPLKYNVAPGVPVPSHFPPEEAAEIDAAKHVIVDCYYIRPYDKDRMHKLVYEMFTKHAKNIGMKPETFIKEENKRAEVKKTFVPHITIRQNKILFFGMEL